MTVLWLYVTVAQGNTKSGPVSNQTLILLCHVGGATAKSWKLTLDFGSRFQHLL